MTAQNVEVLDMTILKEIDKQIVNNTQPIYVNVDTVESLYSQQTWYREYKLESTVLHSLIKHINELKCFNFSLDKAVKGICCLVNYTKRYVHNENKTFFRVPTRFLCTRLECSRDRLIYFIDFLRCLGIIDYKRDNITPKIKVNMPYIENDKYIITKCKSFWTTDLLTINNIQKQFKSLYYYNYTNKVYKRKENEIIMGLTIAYNKKMQQNPNLFYSYRPDENNEDSILYGEFPVHFIAEKLNCSEQQAYYKLKHLFKHTNYIKKHDLVYSDKKFIGKEHQTKYISNAEHYLNKNYKQFAKNKYYKMNDKNGNSYEENHPRVTSCSIIIFTDKFKNSKLGKKVQRDLSMYEDMLNYMLLEHYNNEKIYKDYVYLEQEQKISNLTCFDKTYTDSENQQDNEFHKMEDIELGNIIVNGYTDDDGNKISPIGRAVNLDKLRIMKEQNGDKYRKRYKLYGSAEKRSIESLLKFFVITTREISQCMFKDLNYYCKLLQRILDIIIQKLTSITHKYLTDNSNKYGNILFTGLNVIKYYDVNYGLQIYNNVFNTIKENTANSEWFKAIYNNQYVTSSIDSLLNLEQLSVYKSEESNLYEDIYENGNNINDNLPQCKMEDLWGVI